MKRAETFVEAFTKILAEQGAVKWSDAAVLKKSFLESSQEAFDDFLIQEGLVSRKSLLNALSVYYNVPSFDVRGIFFNHPLLQEFPKDFLLRNEIIPLERDENMLFIVASNPGDEELLPEIGKHVSYDIQYRVGLAQDILDAVEEFYDKSPTEVREDSDLREERLEEERAERVLDGLDNE
jgi:Type II secretion system (T2SS), protein E, N-terminal domain